MMFTNPISWKYKAVAITHKLLDRTFLVFLRARHFQVEVAIVLDRITISIEHFRHNIADRKDIVTVSRYLRRPVYCFEKYQPITQK